MAVFSYKSPTLRFAYRGFPKNSEKYFHAGLKRFGHLISMLNLHAVTGRIIAISK